MRCATFALIAVICVCATGDDFVDTAAEVLRGIEILLNPRRKRTA